MACKIEIKYHLYELRTRSGLTGRDLAKLSGVSKSQISQIENGRANPTLRTLYALSFALDVAFEDLFTAYITP